MADRYDVLIKALYDGSKECHVATEMTFEDGRKGIVEGDIRIIDMHELVTYTDYLVVCSGRSTRQTRRIAEEVTLKLKKELGLVPAHTEGAGDGEWVLIDYLDFIVHVFTPEAREFYRLDVLWKEAPALIIE